MSNLSDLVKFLDESKVKLVSVTKTRTNEQILELYDQGLRIFGENRVKELVGKQESMPKDIQWHMIGHLQTKKVKHIVPFVQMIHSLDRKSLWKEINKHANRNGLKIKCLLEIKIAKETSKSGFIFDELIDLLSIGIQNEFDNVEICGVMGMATFTNDQSQIMSEFNQLKLHFDYLRKHFFKSDDFHWISMGMSGDYKLAINAGANMVRLGSLLFE